MAQELMEGEIIPLRVMAPRRTRWPGLKGYVLQKIEQFFINIEALVKKNTFGCKMCGQCILQFNGFTCPMRCPKNLRDGPCGGVRENNMCEVYPDKPCVHVLGWQRSVALGRVHWWQQVQPIADARLKGTSSWVNHLLGRDRHIWGVLGAKLKQQA